MSLAEEHDGAGRRAPVPSLDAIRSGVLEVWQSVLPGADPDGQFLDVGGSSLTAVLLVTRLEEMFGFVLPFSALVTAAGVDGLVAWFAEQISAPS